MTSLIPYLNHILGSPPEGSPTPTIPIRIPKSSEANCPGLELLSSTFSDDDEHPQQRNIPNINDPPAQRKELTLDEHLTIYVMLLERSEDCKLKPTTTREVSKLYGVGIRTIQSIWKRATDSGNHHYGNGRVHNCGRKMVGFNLEIIKDIPLRRRRTLRSMAATLGVSKSYLHVKLKECVIRRHSNAIHPTLREENLRNIVNHCMTSFDPATVPHDPTFKNMESVMHIDEK